MFRVLSSKEQVYRYFCALFTTVEFYIIIKHAIGFMLEETGEPGELSTGPSRPVPPYLCTGNLFLYCAK